jgi:hypothetical protein
VFYQRASGIRQEEPSRKPANRTAGGTPAAR